MIALRRLLPCTLLLPLAALAGCAALSSDYWRGPSILTTVPPEPQKQARRETQGGFTVLVDAPGQPAAARVIADIGAFAQRRGFVRETAQAGAERYVFGQTTLEVAFRSSDSHVVASLHGFRLNRKFVASFYLDFDREYAPRYGDEDPIIESDFGDDSNGASGGVRRGR